MGKFLKTIIFTITLFFVFGCSGGSYSILNGNINANKNSIVGNYDKFSGKYYKTVKLSKNDVITFTIFENTISGEITFYLVDSKNNIVVELNESQEVKIDESGKYKVVVKAGKHSGSFSINWLVK